MWVCYGVFTLSETENDFCSETDEMAKSSQSQWLLLAISSVLLQKSFSVSLSVKTPLWPSQWLKESLVWMYHNTEETDSASSTVPGTNNYGEVN